MLLGLFAAIGVLLAAIGLYGVMSFLVTHRTQEIGVRMALGATSGNILGLVFASAMRWTAAGILIGLLGSLAATRWLRSLLYQVPERDPGRWPSLSPYFSLCPSRGMVSLPSRPGRGSVDCVEAGMSLGAANSW
jgi:predicted lysophospholipase L1 biosynthesis ABC-type transport system permease subunit